MQGQTFVTKGVKRYEQDLHLHSQWILVTVKIHPFYKETPNLELRWDKRCIHGPAAFSSLCSPVFPSIVLCPHCRALCEWVCSTGYRPGYTLQIHTWSCAYQPFMPAHPPSTEPIYLVSISHLYHALPDLYLALCRLSLGPQISWKEILSGPVLQPKLIQLHRMPPVLFFSPPSPALLSYPCGLVHLRISSTTLIPSHINAKALKHAFCFRILKLHVL